MNKKNNHGGKREGAGKKSKNKEEILVPLTIMIHPDDKSEIKAKYGRSFNQIFRDWIKTLIR